MTDRKPPRRAPPPLNQERLQELGLRYVGRFATTRAKLRHYLTRKLRERGWDDAQQPDVEALANRFAELGYIDDRAYAVGKAQGLSSRGYGKRRVVDALRIAGIGDEDSAPARELADGEALTAALRFAERRRIGPFASEPTSDPRVREKAIAAMVRAGHGFPVARAIVALAPGQAVDREMLASEARLIVD